MTDYWLFKKDLLHGFSQLVGQLGSQ